MLVERRRPARRARSTPRAAGRPSSSRTTTSRSSSRARSNGSVAMSTGPPAEAVPAAVASEVVPAVARSGAAFSVMRRESRTCSTRTCSAPCASRTSSGVVGAVARGVGDDVAVGVADDRVAALEGRVRAQGGEARARAHRARTRAPRERDASADPRRRRQGLDLTVGGPEPGAHDAGRAVEQQAGALALGGERGTRSGTRRGRAPQPRARRGPRRESAAGAPSRACCAARPSRCASSARSGTASSAATDGVAARTSAANSASVTSVSWPTPTMIGARMRGDRADDRLLVERPQVLERAAAAREDDEVDRASARRVGPAADAAQRADDRVGGAGPLDEAGAHDDRARAASGGR